MTFKELQEFNNKQKYPFNIELSLGHFSCYNPLYEKKGQGTLIHSSIKDYNEFIEGLMIRNVFEHAKQNIEFDNKHLIVHKDYVEVGYNSEDENHNHSIQHFKIQRNEL